MRLGEVGLPGSEQRFDVLLGKLLTMETDNIVGCIVSGPDQKLCRPGIALGFTSPSPNELDYWSWESLHK